MGSILGKKELTGKFARWAKMLQQFPLTYQYRPAKENVAADALSRIDGESESVATLNLESLKECQSRDKGHEGLVEEVEVEVVEIVQKMQEKNDSNRKCREFVVKRGDLVLVSNNRITSTK